MSRTISPGRLAAVLGPCALALAIAAPAAGASFSEPIRIRSGWSGPVAGGTDGQGRIHLVVQDDDGLVSLHRVAGSWTSTRIVTDDFSADVDLDVAVDSDGHTWVLYVPQCGEWHCSNGLHLVTDATGGAPDASWSKPMTLVDANVGMPTIAVADGRVHIAYAGKNLHLHHLSDASGAWVDTILAGTTSSHPSIAVDRHGRAHIGYVRHPRTNGPWGIIWARDTGTPGAPHFVERVVPGTETEFNLDVELVLDRFDRARLVWARESMCGVGDCGPTSSEGAWTTSWRPAGWKALRHVSSAPARAVALDPGGRLHVLTADLVLVTLRPDGTFQRERATVRRTHHWPELLLARDGAARVFFSHQRWDAGVLRRGLYEVAER